MTEYFSVHEAAALWGLSERSVRNYCAAGRVEGAFLSGKTWKIPKDAQKPIRQTRTRRAADDLLSRLRAEKSANLRGGVYHKIQVELTYNSNHIEGSRLTEDQTRWIFETNTVGAADSVRVDDIIETTNHFRCIDFVIDAASRQLNEKLILQLHAMLKNGTNDARLDWFAVGGYKKLPNEIGGKETTLPENVSSEMKALLADYNAKKEKTLDDLLNFHYRFESIHPFQDGNGRIGRLILFKECLHFRIVPFIISDDFKLYYYRGLQSWPTERGYLRETCLAAQDNFKKTLDYFRISY